MGKCDSAGAAFIPSHNNEGVLMPRLQTGIAQCADLDQAARFDTQRRATCKVDANTRGVSHTLSQFQTGKFGLIKATWAMPFAALAKYKRSLCSFSKLTHCQQGRHYQPGQHPQLTAYLPHAPPWLAPAKPRPKTALSLGAGLASFPLI